jgi:hypothetical protein
MRLMYELVKDERVMCGPTILELSRERRESLFSMDTNYARRSSVAAPC